MKKVVIYLLTSLLTVSFCFPVSASSISELRKQENEIKNNTEKTQQQLNSTQEKKSQVLSEVETLDLELTEVTDLLNMINSELDKTNVELENTQKELVDAEDSKNSQYDTLQQRVRFMYESGKTGYLDLLFSAGSFVDFLNRLDYVNYIYQSDNELLDRLTETETFISQKKEDIEDQKREIEILISQQNKKVQELEYALAKKEEALSQLMTDESNFAQQLSDWAKAENDVQDLIKKAEEEARRKAAEEARRKAEEEAKKKAAAAAAASAATAAAQKNYYTGGLLAWPVPDSYRVTSEYGNRLNPFNKKVTEFHGGIDIGAPTGTNIVAAEAGVVIFVGTKGSYGLTVIIDHGSSLSTLYAHASKLLVSTGQEVSRGQAIAKVGSTGYSTGPHLHFEVRKNGSHTNPTSYLKK